MADTKTRLRLDDFSGGRNAIDSPLGPNFAANQVLDATNGDWYHTTGFRKRHGSSHLGMTSSGFIFPGVVSWLGRHVPATAEGAAELWGVDDFIPPVFQRLTGGTVWQTITVTNAGAIGNNTYDFTSASLNGKFFIAFPGLSNRLHCWDPMTGTVRPTGLNPGVFAPTVANDGVGAYPATLIYVRVRFTFGAAGFNRVISEPTPAASITPSGAGAGILVTRPALPSECENLWYVEVSTDGATFYVLTGLPTATTSYTITTVPVDFSIFTLSPFTGTYTLQQPYRFIAADNNRLLGFGTYDSTGIQNRVEWSAIVGTTILYGGAVAIGAEERVDTTVQSYLDLDEKDSGVPTALIGPAWGNFYAFKTRQLWELAPTGSTDQPYRKTAISKALGCVGPHAAVVGEDGLGDPCIYFMSHRGMYRFGEGGLRFIGNGIEDYILGPTATLNLHAAKVICHLVYHQDKRQVWVWFATGTADDPTELFLFDVRANQGEGGWSRLTGPLADARCSVMFADTIGATMGIPLVPYVGDATAVNTVRHADDPTAWDDSGVPFAASITTRPLEVPGYKMETGDVIVLAPTATGVLLTATVTPDFGAAESISERADLTPLDSEFEPTRVSRRIEGTAMAQVEFLQITLGDELPVANQWSVDRIVIPITKAQAIA